MTGIIILAAGSSSRLGEPKQNLVYKGLTLLLRAVDTALTSFGGQVIVVLGANAEAIRPSIGVKPVTIIQNKNWQDGMASSIHAGVMQVKDQPNIDSVILMLCDQPFVTGDILNALIEKRSAGGIVACEYNGTLGPPALFDKIYFDELLLMTGQEGAKNLIQKYPHAVTIIPFADGSIDIDTMEDYRRIL